MTTASAILAAPLLPAQLGGGVPAAVWLFALLGAATAAAQLLLYSGIARRDRLAPVAVWAAVGVECAVVAALAGSGAATVGAVVTTAVAVALALGAAGLARVAGFGVLA